ncbi:hypothetical protein HNP40_000308 [Mycobacteroides chelonae]|nr:hypothetical protein [Mycobacteroides chelonae]
MRQRLQESLFSFRGRVVTAVLVLVWAGIFAGALVYYHLPVFWGFLIPLGIGIWALVDAVKRQRAGEFDDGV